MVQRKLNTERVQVAATLRRMREKAGFSRSDSAGLLGCTPSKISDLENGRSGPKAAELERLLDFYGADGAERDELITFARESRKRKPRGTYTNASVSVNYRRGWDLETQSVAAVFYSAELIPGPLQVRPYAEALLGCVREAESVEVQTLVDLRLARRASLTRQPPLKYRAILAEGALRSGIGGPEVMAEQIAHLIEVNETMPNVVVQVMPLGAGEHPLLGLTLTLYSFAPPAPDTMILEGHGRDVLQDDPAGVARTAEHVALVRAKALDVQESTAYLRGILREMEAT